MSDPTPEITQILQTIEAGDPDARAELIAAAYEDLRRLASGRMSRERQDHALTATALVHEVSVKFLDDRAMPTTNRQHFFAYAARAMRSLLIDHARGKGRQVRGGDRERVSLDQAMDVPKDEHRQLLALNDALDELAEIDPRKAQIVELKYFGRMTNQEIADALDMSITTVKRDWEVARGWLFREVRR